LLDKYSEILKKLKINPFGSSLKTHKLKEDKIILVDIGTHDDVY
jgi:mRNA-degrading endonuclease YafQ of YafQ-DinJ toxin-antitoxin module